MSGPVLEAIHRLAPGFRARFGFVLGSGMGGFAGHVKDAVEIPYTDLPDFGESGVSGHAGRLVLGRLGRVPVAILQGRIHYYERGEAAAMLRPIETLKELGCEALVVTNAAGSLVPDVGPGSLMMLTDHMNLVQESPLFGISGDRRFVDMVDAYDPALRVRMMECAKAARIGVTEGVYAWVSGPQFETPAEIRALRALGADAVGMSTVPDVILARYFGMKVLALSAITNFGAGMGSDALSHEHTLAQVNVAAGKLTRLLLAFMETA